ncbi:hypothetical protein PTKIN_Ptkin04bG0084200 [Pterospermum kingtungense]
MERAGQGQQVSSNEGPEAPQSCCASQPWAAPPSAFASYSPLHHAFEVCKSLSLKLLSNSLNHEAYVFAS